VYSHILVLLDYNQEEQSALKKALVLYKYLTAKDKNAVDLTLMVAQSHDPVSMTTLFVLDQDRFADERQNLLHKWLLDYVKTHLPDLPVKTAALYKKEVGKAVVAYSKEQCVTLIVKAKEKHTLFDDVMESPLDLQLLRNTAVPILLTSKNMESLTGPVLVGLNTFNDSELSTNMRERLLREGKWLATFCRVGLKVVHIEAPIVPPVYNTDDIYHDDVEEDINNIREFARSHKIKDEDCIFLEGSIFYELLDTIKKENPSFLILGTAARRGLSSAFLGNLCERILASSNCDVLVLTPKTVFRNLPTPYPSKSLY